MTNTLTATEPARNYFLKSGSTPDGAFALDLTATDPPSGLTDELAAITIRNGLLSATDRNGQAIPGTSMGLHVALGTTESDPLAIMDGLVTDELPRTGEQAARGTGQASVTSVSTSGALTTVTTSTTDGEAGTSSTTQRRTYQYRDSKYVLQEMQVDVAENTSGEQVSRQVRMQFQNVTWFEGLEEAEMSSSEAIGGDVEWGGGGTTHIPPQTCSETNPCEPPPVPPGSGSGGGCSTPPLAPTGANIVYVHGINAEGSTWGSTATNNAVRGKTRCDLLVANDIAPSLTLGGNKGLGYHAQQATQLRSDVIASGLNNLIFVGHSQGGLISRRAAQSLQGAAGAPSIRGVVTTGTPHLGANIARNLSLVGLPGRIAQTFGGGYACRVTTQCSAVTQATTAIQNQLPTAVLTSNAMFDLRPSSSAIQQVNAQPESFRRFGIQNALTHGFLFFQIAGDAVSGNKGRLVREVVTAVSIVALATAIVATIVSIFKPWAAVVAARAAQVFAAIIGANLVWSTLTYGNRPSDGVVENTSQRYPANSPGTYQPVSRQSLDPSSHTAQSDSERSAEDIQITLTRDLNVQER